MPKKTLMSWSSGKDSAWALHKLQQDPGYDVKGLFCTINKEFQRVAMHGVRLELLNQQAIQMGLPIKVLELPYPCSNEDYESIMREFTQHIKADGIECIGFGDLFLEDIRAYREEKLNDTGIKAIFPLWGIPTNELSKEMLDGGLKTVITCVDPKQAPAELAGKEYDHNLIASLANSIDPCGENGEFHSFVYDGPMFKDSIDITVGDTIEHDGFFFADIMPKQS